MGNLGIRLEGKQETLMSSGQLDLLGGSLGSNETSVEGGTANKKSETSELLLENCDGSEIKSPKKLLIVDTETTGLDSAEDHCLEVGSILFHVSSRTVLAQQAFLLPVSSNKAESINRIPAEITRVSQPWEEGMKYLESLIGAADVLVAHNASFDRQWFGMQPLPEVEKPWLCSMDDIAWPVHLNLKPRPSVRDLALAYGIPVWSAHRALTDCIYISEVFRRCSALETLLLQGLEPKRLMRAKVSYDERFLAKQAGFRWNDPVRGAWTRKISERQASELNFLVVPVESDG